MIRRKRRIIPPAQAVKLHIEGRPIAKPGVVKMEDEGREMLSHERRVQRERR